MSPDLISLPTLTVRGTARELGEAQGEHLRALIGAFMDVRFSAVEQYCKDRGLPGADALIDVARIGLERLKSWDPEGFAEHEGIARGAGVDPIRLYGATQMTDLRDVLVLPAEVDEGCTSLLLAPDRTRGDAVIGGQTWDLNPPDVDFIVAIERRPTAGPATWSVTCAGCLSLMGINEDGVALGTTNIKTRDSRADGVGYLALIHRGLRARSAMEAAEAIAGAPRAAAHTYWIVDPRQAISLETSPSVIERRAITHGAFVQTNHCQAKALAAMQGEPTSDSSQRRLEVATARAQAGGHDWQTVRDLFADRSAGILSVNRYAEDDQGTSTNAVFIALPAERAAWACRGPADRGRFIRLGFA
ncbi:MAG: C45 family peptidase [bacterium]